MPGSLLDTDIYFPQTMGKDQEQINKEVLDYLYMLRDDLRYSFGNLGINNFNGTELDTLAKQIRAPVLLAIEGLNGDLTELSVTAKGINARLEGAEGNITTLSAASEGLMARMTSAEGNITAITATAEGINARLSNAEGDLTTVTAIAEGLVTRVENAEGDLTQLTVTAEGIGTRLSDAEGSLTTLSENAEGVSLWIANAENDLTQLKASAEGLTVSVKDLTTGMGHTLRLGEDGMTVYDAEGNKVTISNGCLNLTGAITWSDLNSDTQGKVNTAQSTANSAAEAAEAAQSTADTVTTVVNRWKMGDSTYIDGGMVGSPVMAAKEIYGEVINVVYDDIYGREIISGYITTGMTNGEKEGELADGLGLWSNGGGVLCAYYNLYLTAGSIRNYNGRPYGVGPSIQLMIPGYDALGARVQINSGPLVSGNERTLGTSAQRWGTVYSSSGTIQTSDRDLKHDIEALPDKYVRMVDALEPVRYKYDDGTSNRYHVGFIAQDVKTVMDELGIDSTEFGGYVADVDDRSLPIYMLRYEEFIGIL